MQLYKRETVCTGHHQSYAFCCHLYGEDDDEVRESGVKPCGINATFATNVKYHSPSASRQRRLAEINDDSSPERPRSSCNNDGMHAYHFRHRQPSHSSLVSPTITSTVTLDEMKQPTKVALTDPSNWLWYEAAGAQSNFAPEIYQGRKISSKKRRSSTAIRTSIRSSIRRVSSLRSIFSKD